jgi:hypothetical protein
MRARNTCLLAAMTMALAWGGLQMPAQPALALEGTDQPIALSGDMPIGIGADAVTIAVMPDSTLKPGESRDILVIDDAEVTVDSGVFEARVNPAEIPAAYVDPQGIVDFEVYGTDGDSGWITDVSARITHEVGTPTTDKFWTDPGDSAPLLVTSAKPSSKTNGNIRVPKKAGRGALARSTELEDDGVTVGDFTEVPDTTFSGCVQADTGESATRWATIGTSYTVGSSTGWISVSTSVGAKYGVGVSTGGGFSANGTLWADGGWSKTWNDYSGSRSYQKQIRYEKFVKTCGVPGWTYTTTYWKPQNETGGTDHNDGIDRPDWTHCVPEDPGPWARDAANGYAYSYGSAVKFASLIGIDLSIEKNWSSNQSLNYNIHGDNQRACGNNADPSLAGKIMLKWRS